MLETYCKLHVKYGEKESVLYLTLSVRFVGGPITPEVPAVVFSARQIPALVGQERLVRIATPEAVRELVVLDIPPWLKCQVLPKTGRDFRVRLKVCQLPPDLAVTHTLRLAGNGVSQQSTPLRVSTFASTRQLAAAGGPP